MQNRDAGKKSIAPFAITDFRDIKRCFGIKDKNRSGHIYILGKTGTGKSTLIQNMIGSDIKRGHGLALIDPHGDLAEEVLGLVPKRRVKDVLYFNPADLDFPIAFNPLEKVGADKRHLIASGLIAAFKKIWAEFWGPRMEHILRNCILALLEYPESTLLDLPPMLTDKDFRSRVLQKVSNPGVRDFWLLEFERYSAWFRSEAVSPILNKVGQFLATPLIRNIVGQAKSSFDLREVMDDGKILIANLAKGKIGEDNCSLLGAMLVSKMQLAALSRAETPEGKRTPFHLFIDEIQSFLTLSFCDALSESRKYGLYLVLTHQYIEQLDEKIRAAIFGNAGTIISFRVGAEDAKYLAREFHPTFSETDLVNLPNHNIYLKMMIDGHTCRPFSAVTLPPAKNSISHRNLILEASREKYGRPRKEIEQEILLRSTQNLPRVPGKKTNPTLF
jgi:type IV secretory pathway TraG/TraD family ATPase VirD4